MWWCKGIRITGWEVVGERMQLKIDTSVCGLMWGVGFQIVLSIFNCILSPTTSQPLLQQGKMCTNRYAMCWIIWERVAGCS